MRYSAPFPHVVIDDYLSPEQVRAINAEWPSQWNDEKARHAFKRNTQDLPRAASLVVFSINANWVAEQLRIPGTLFADPKLFGAGLHAIPPGGYLKMHVDFNVHPQGWHRKANALIYLNEGWRPEWGGALQLGLGADSVRIEPRAGRLVMFETTETSWHGHPEPLQCPADRQRRSLALYFYSHTRPMRRHNTIYREAP